MKMSGAFGKALSSGGSYETLKKIAHGVDIAKDATWVASAALANSPTSQVLRSVIAGTEVTLDTMRFYGDRKGEFSKPRKVDKYTGLIWAGLGTASLAVTVADVLSGDYAKIPSDASNVAASYMNVLSRGLHYLADKKY
jgi:hypothetical protein